MAGGTAGGTAATAFVFFLLLTPVHASPSDTCHLFILEISHNTKINDCSYEQYMLQWRGSNEELEELIVSKHYPYPGGFQVMA